MTKASMRKTVYGKYSLGSGAILKDPERVWSALADADTIASYRTSIEGDLARAGISVSALADWDIMDVGTGRQTLAFLEMGARHVDHFDLAPENVAAMREYIARTGMQDRVTTTACDLVAADLGRERFDFIYLNGIAQHFSNVGSGLVKCLQALKPGGVLWLYFYRSGSFDQFWGYTLRTLVTGGNVVSDNSRMREYDAASRLFFSEDGRRTYLTSVFMDAVFTPYAWLYRVKDYLDFAEACGLEVIGSSGIEPPLDVDHLTARGAGVVTLKKKRNVDPAERMRAAERLSPERSIDQLNPALYGQEEIRRSVALIDELKGALQGAAVPPSVRALVALRLFSFFMRTTKAPGYDAARRHTDLQILLTATLAMLRDEFAAGSPTS